MLFPPDYVNQLRVFAVLNQFRPAVQRGAAYREKLREQRTVTDGQQPSVTGGMKSP